MRRTELGFSAYMLIHFGQLGRLKSNFGAKLLMETPNRFETEAVATLQEMHSEGLAGYGFGYRPGHGTVFVTIDSAVNNTDC